MTAPKRIQLRRTKGSRKPQGAIVVARPSRWGNPYAESDPAAIVALSDDFQVEVPLTAEHAVALYRELMAVRLWWEPDHHPEDIALARGWATALEELRGRDLACWCPIGEPCHADVLLALANGSSFSTTDEASR